METQGKWLWKKTETEKFYEPFAISYQLTIVTREPLLEEQVIRALTHCQRKVPILKTCFGERDGDIWIREMTQEIIDYELLPDDTKDADLHDKIQQYSFNKETGPLWCVKLKPEFNVSPDAVFGEGVAGFPHRYSLFLGINHAVTDGTSNVIVCGFIVQILDDILAGKEINDEEQLGIYISDEKTKKAIEEQVALVKGNPELQSKLVADWQVLQGRRSLLKTVFKGVGEEKGRSLYRTQNLDAKTTAAFIKRCRAEGITVNSAFAAIANFTVVDLLVHGGFERDSYSIRSTHVVNARRYLEGDTSQYLGCHIMLLNPIFETPRNFSENFWNSAKSIHEEIHSKIKSGYPLQLEGVSDLVSKTPYCNPIFEFEYTTTNMGDITQKITEGGDHVQVLHLLRTADLCKVPCTCNNFIHTLRGHLTHTIVHNSAYFTPHMAEMFCEKVFHYLRACLEI
ncbi:hypothetical protein C7M84_007054 [Penaeus vannamei]|uniref:Condensation domain-containing protein n=1 Tax=Penaeus vannamei TaxID=6689 RepID=A0A423TDA5_PENVA|nr:uncharacterized protein LOC113808269 [Penaeus vannamei]XP_027215421.1 uncharacterized protein LOC113808269 [Penaeus vannamei]ROT74435.1 hypothetical protein C7M84_007054 [Penaeus vannamei]